MARVAKSLQTLWDQVKAAYPGRADGDDGTLPSNAHHQQNPKSDHEADINGIGHALDLTHDPRHGFDSYEFADMLIDKDHRDPRIKYVISNRRIAGDAGYAKRNGVKAWTWAPYFGPNPHDHHVHISVNAANAENPAQWKIDMVTVLDPNAPFVISNPILRRGSKGADVITVQKILHIKEDGDFGKITENAVIAFQRMHGLVADGVVGRMTWNELGKDTDEGLAPRLNFIPNVMSSVFGGTSEIEKSAYDGHRVGETELAVALPYRFPAGARPKVKVTNRQTGLSGIGTVEDVGPWNGINKARSDPYWQEVGRRPQAETGIDLNGRRTNLAGIDLSPALAKAIGSKDPKNWMGRVDVEIIWP